MKHSISKALSFGLSIALLAGCTKPAAENKVETRAATPISAAAKAAGNDTIAKGLAGSDGEGKFLLAVKAAGLEPTLAGPGPYTVLVPDDNAFAKLPPGAVDGLVAPDKKATLVRLLTIYILPGTIMSTDIFKAIDAHGGSAKLMTMSGEPLAATRNGDKILVSDAVGNKAVITSPDAKRSNGVVHQIDTLLSPKS